VTIYVERSSQKGILIGDAGASIRSLGTAARKRIERFLGRPVYLDLWVKVLPNWRRKPEQLRRLGLPVPHDDRAR
jgi:GTP-binding protein Era